MRGPERAYSLAVSGQAEGGRDCRQRQVTPILAARPAEDWPRHRAGTGAQGPRWYAWYGLPLAAPRRPAWRRWLVSRRSVREPTAPQVSHLVITDMHAHNPAALEQVLELITTMLQYTESS